MMSPAPEREPGFFVFNFFLMVSSPWMFVFGILVNLSRLRRALEKVSWTMAVTGTKGRHVIAEYWGCAPEILGNLEVIQDRMMAAARDAGATIVETVFHPFTPTGVSGVVVVEESHLSIHTWPEEGYAACDFYTCGSCVPERAIKILEAALAAKDTYFMVIDRGLPASKPSMKIHDL